MLYFLIKLRITIDALEVAEGKFGLLKVFPMLNATFAQEDND